LASGNGRGAGNESLLEAGIGNGAGKSGNGAAPGNGIGIPGRGGNGAGGKVGLGNCSEAFFLPFRNPILLTLMRVGGGRVLNLTERRTVKYQIYDEFFTVS